MRFLFVFFAVAALAGVSGISSATDFSSTNFTVKDPVLTSGGGYATSSNFRLWSAVSQPAIGTGSSATYGVRAGFLYFPEPSAVSIPAPSPTPSPSYSSSSGGPIIQLLRRLISPLPPPLIPPIGRLPGERGLVGVPCNRRSDFNCDGRVDLQDFSILLHVPARVSTRNLSFFLFDWTERLPEFVGQESLFASAPAGGEEGGAESLPPGFAQVSEVLGASGAGTGTVRTVPETGKRTGGFLSFIREAAVVFLRGILQILRFLKSVIW